MIKYSIPFNGDLSLMEEVFETGRVWGVYFAGSSPCDRSLVYFTDYYRRFRDDKINRLLKLAQKYKVRANLLFNSPFLSFMDVRKEMAYIRSLKGLLDSVTLSDPYQVCRFKEAFPYLKIEASIIMNLDSFTKIEKILKKGVSIVNIPLDLNRDIKNLKRIAKLKQDYPEFEIKLLPNHVCFYGCPFSSFHYFIPQAGAVFKPKIYGNVNFDKCNFPSPTLEELIKRPFIRPQDISFYVKRGLADIFKLCFRTDPTQVLRKVIFAYLNGRYEGNLFDIITTIGNPPLLYWDNQNFPRDFIEKVTNCDKSACRECGYCKRISKRVFRRLKHGEKLSF